MVKIRHSSLAGTVYTEYIIYIYKQLLKYVCSMIKSIN